MERLKLPIGMQTFETLRTEGFVYVDKTKYLVDLIDQGCYYLLARPRCFGKSLIISTFEALFSGRKDLFEGLDAEEFLTRPGFQPSPVIRLDMSKVITDEGMDGIENTIAKQVRDIANELNVDLSDSHLPGYLLNDLIMRTAKQYNQKVVVLVDEYDKPYTDFMNNPEMAENVRIALRNIYLQIKANDSHTRFVFLTGISKYSGLSAFSTLNLDEISMMPEYAGICGYTEEEIIQYFPDYLEDTAGEMQISTDELIGRMRHYYNGFSFDDKAKASLYNPYAILQFFSHKTFSNFWFQTATTKFIVDFLKDKNLTVEQFRNFWVSYNFLNNPGDMDVTSPAGFLYQNGYLTVRTGIIDELSLDYPNTEVLNSMSELLA